MASAAPLSARPARVMVVDPRPSARRAVSAALASDERLRVVAGAPDVAAAVALLAGGTEVDVVALDLRAARPDPASAIARLGVPVVLLRIEHGPSFAAHALAAGAAALARKDDPDAIVDSVTAVAGLAHAA